MRKIFWAPGSVWRIEENILYIDNLKFDGVYKKIFPEFYYETIEGIQENDLIERFVDLTENQIKEFISKLKIKKILIDDTQDIPRIFWKQSRFFYPETQLPEDYFFNKENIAQWRKKASMRQIVSGDKQYYVQSEKDDDLLNKRRSCRQFDTHRTISEDVFFDFLSVMIPKDTGGDFLQYDYPSAGGLYPVDIYIQIKKNRIEGIDGGIYYLCPYTKSLNLISNQLQVTSDFHFFLNKEIFNTSAFSIFMVFNSEVSIPKYKDNAIYYGILDAGILIGYLNIMAQKNGLSCCSIGELRKSIDDILKLKAGQKYLHTIEFGYAVE